MIKIFYLLLTPLSFFIVLSCGQNLTNKNANLSDTNEKEDSIKFLKYYSNLQDIKLPLTLRCGLSSEIPYNYAPFKGYFKRNFDSPLYVAGKIYNNEVFISLLYGIVGDDLYPVLFNFNNNGTKIDSLDLSGSCDGDEGFLSSTTVTFNQDYSIFKVDSVTRYDDNILAQSVSDTTTIVYYKYRILNSGHFTLEDSSKNEVINFRSL